MKALENIKLIKARILKVAKNNPAKPLKGRGYDRIEIEVYRVFELLKKHAPNHCETVSSREKVNGYGKIGFVGHAFVSPELYQVIAANSPEFTKLEIAMKTIEEFGL